MSRLAILLGFIVSLPALAEPQPRETSFGADRFAAGPTVSVADEVPGDLFAAGGAIDVDAAVRGDAVLAGGTVRLGAPVGQDLYLTGGRLNVAAPVMHNARIAGGNVQMGPKARIAGNLSVAGGDIRIEAPIGGYLQVGGGHVYLDSSVAGDVRVGAGSVELGPNARIAGRLRYASREELQKSAQAEVKGGIERIPLPERGREARKHAGRAFHWLWSAGLIVLAAVLAALLPNISLGTAAAVRTRWPWSLLVGFIALVCIPTALIIAVITVIGIPLALAALALYFALLLLGYATSGIAIGLAALQRWRPARAPQAAMRIVFAALGMLAVVLLASIPWIGGLVALAALFLGVGALLQQFKRQSTTT
ncbi:MAG TPA: polymer-forming cytoskeletal protein [Burkholderiales bacterium]|nr:polymer-forming cytoskeletal protein [Burkholderiales bacterium]